MFPLAFPSPHSLFTSFSVSLHNDKAQPLPRDGNNGSSPGFSAQPSTAEGSFSTLKGLDHKQQRGVLADLVPVV